MVGAVAQPVVAEAEPFTVRLKLHDVMSLTSMNWPSQKSAPLGSEQRVLQPPVRETEQSALHWIFACTLHDPLQLSWHSVVQSVEPG